MYLANALGIDGYRWQLEAVACAIDSFNKLWVSGVGF
jgi:hypothetical protein